MRISDWSSDVCSSDLRDSDGDGAYEARAVFAENLNAPYGLALVGDDLYVANQDSLVRFNYRDGQTRASGQTVKVTDLPSQINHQWTKSLAASPDGRILYVGKIGRAHVCTPVTKAEIGSRLQLEKKKT